MIAILLSSLAFAGTTIDAGMFAGTSEFTPMLSMYSAGQLGEGKFTAFAFGMATPGWGQAYAGLGWAPTEWLAVELGAGLETIPEAPWRVGGDIWLGSGRWSLLTFAEYGGSGFWYKAIGGYNATDWLTVGAMSQAYRGHGPRLEVAAGEHATLYAAALWRDGPMPIGHGGIAFTW